MDGKQIFYKWTDYWRQKLSALIFSPKVPEDPLENKIQAEKHSFVHFIREDDKQTLWKWRDYWLQNLAYICFLLFL